MKSRWFAIMTIFTPIAFAWMMSYLIGSFISASWNLIEWTEQARFLTAIWGCVFAFAVWYRLEISDDIV